MRSIIRATQDALRHLQGIATSGLPHVRIGVKGGGCNGLQYVVTPTDTVGPLDEVVDHTGLRLVVCGHSLMHLGRNGLSSRIPQPKRNFEVWVRKDVCAVNCYIVIIFLSTCA